MFRNFFKKTAASGLSSHLPVEILFYYVNASLCEKNEEPKSTGNDAADGIKDPGDRQYHFR